MLKKDIKVEIDAKEASLTQKEASQQSKNVKDSSLDYCPYCKSYVTLLPKMGGLICPLCRTIISSFSGRDYKDRHELEK